MEQVVNAMLTQIDQLRGCGNVLILTTSNITGAIDVAFVDRADIKLYVGVPCPKGVYQILLTCILELTRAGILSDKVQILSSLLSVGIEY